MRFVEEQKAELLAMIDNLAIIKIFHDAGINVEKFPDIEVMVLHGIDEGTFIFETGVSRIFGDCTLISHFDNEEDDNTIERIKQVGNLEYKCDFAFIIPLELFEMSFNHLPKAIELCNIGRTHEDGKFVGDIENKKLYIPVEGMGGLSEVARRVILLYEELKKEIQVQ